ncbi:hypothetical protein RCO48_39850 [Peribacillus frigoritolerans]|nr:hypothetical protein [Peribacillus frigoritolerans]
MEDWTINFVHKGEQKELHFGNRTIQVTMIGQRNQSIVAPIKAATTLMVVDDQLYHEITADVPLKEMARVRGYEVKDWEESMETSSEIEQMSINPDHNQLQTRAPIYQEMKQGSILILFYRLVCQSIILYRPREHDVSASYYEFRR